MCLEVDCRLAADGSELKALTEPELARIKSELERLKPDAVAINLLFSFLDDSQEKALQAIIPDAMFTARSSFVLPEYKEYERGMATWLNASLGPLVTNYLSTLQQQLSPSPVAVMQSSGGTLTRAKPHAGQSICCYRAPPEAWLLPVLSASKPQSHN